MASNVQYKVAVGQRWAYVNYPDGKEDIWEIASLSESPEGPLASLRMISGRDPDYHSLYLANKIIGPNWQPRSSVIEKVLYTCPRCDGSNPIADNDYVCNFCRESLTI